MSLTVNDKPVSLESEVEYLRSIIRKIPGNIFWKKTNGQFLGCNENVAKILNLSDPKEIIGKTNYDLFDPVLAYEAEETDRNVIASGMPISFEEIGLNERGEKTFYMTTKAPLYNEENEIIGILGSGVDISLIKESELKLKESNEKLRQLDELRSEFVENMQHDLRTPLSGLYMIMDVLRKEEKEPERAELFNLGFSAASQLMQILDEFVNIGKYDANEFALTTQIFNLKEMVESVLRLEALQIVQKGLQLHYIHDDSCPHEIASDMYRLRGILINVLSNAVKFTDQGSIELRLRVLKKEQKDFLEFSVKDTGSGIAPEYQEFIFEKFKKIKPSNRGEYSGLGAGLYLVRRFISELSGEFRLKSEIGIGTECVWIIPLS